MKLHKMYELVRIKEVHGKILSFLEVLVYIKKIRTV